MCAVALVQQRQRGRDALVWQLDFIADVVAEQWGRLTVEELKSDLAPRLVPLSGLKADLVQKIGDETKSNFDGEAPTGASSGAASSAS